MTSYMPDFIRVEATPQGTPRGSGRTFTAAVEMLRVGLLLSVAALVWHYLAPLSGKPKLHGAILAAAAFLFTLQEYLFFQARGRLGEVLKSTAVSTADLGVMLARSQGMKKYLDSTWLWALSNKIVALIAGSLLLLGSVSTVTFPLNGLLVPLDSILGVIGWFCVINAGFLTLKTFRVYRHVDGVLAQLEVKARELAVRREMIKAIKAAPVEDWRKDPSLSGYERLPSSQE